MSDDKNDLVSVGVYDVHECRKIFRELSNLEIPFESRIEHSEIQKMDIPQAVTGGTFGRGAKLEVFVGQDDEQDVLELIHKVALKIIV